MARVPVDTQWNPPASLEEASGADEAPYFPPSHTRAFDTPDCNEQLEHKTVVLLAELRHWWWAGLISDGEYRAKEEEILRLGT